MRIPSRVYISQQQIVSRGHQARSGEEIGDGHAQGLVRPADVQVSVSPRAAELARQGAADARRIERLKQSIADGSFQIDPQRIAERMVDQE